MNSSTTRTANIVETRSQTVLSLAPSGPTHRGERVWLGDHQGLLAAADAAGLPVRDAAALLSKARKDGDESVSGYADKLEEGLARASQLGAQSVPLLAIGDPHHPLLLSGAVSAAEILDALQQAATM